MGFEKSFPAEQQDGDISLAIETDHTESFGEKKEIEWTEIDLETGTDFSPYKESQPAEANDKPAKLCPHAYEKFGRPSINIFNVVLLLMQLSLIIYLSFFTDCVLRLDSSKTYQTWFKENTCDISHTSLVILPAWTVITMAMYVSLWYCCKHLAFNWLMCMAGPIFGAWLLRGPPWGRSLQLLLILLVWLNFHAFVDDRFSRFGKCMESGREQWLEMEKERKDIEEAEAQQAEAKEADVE